MATTENTLKFWDEHKLLDPDGPVCLIVKAKMGVAADLDRFQPAGFPEVGYVIYDAPRPEGRSEKVCIVDSPASMANHLERVCQAGENDPALHESLSGLPYIKCLTDRNPTFGDGNVTLNPDDPRDNAVFTSLTEGHRIASDYFLDAYKLMADNRPDDRCFRDVLRDEFGLVVIRGKKKDVFFIPLENWWKIYKTLFKYDPNSLIHGVLFAKEQIKISRFLTAHLEAFGAARVGRSGVKFDRLGKTNSGQPIFAVNDETAREIRATFILDLGLLRSYGRDGRGGSEGVGLNRRQKELLLALALWKVRELVRRTFSYRSGCKLHMQEMTIRSGDQGDGEVPLATELPPFDIASVITTAEFAADPVTRVYYPGDKLYKLGKGGKGDEGSAEDDAGDDDGEGESEG